MECKGHTCPQCGNMFFMYLHGAISKVCCTERISAYTLLCSNHFGYRTLISRPYDDFAEWVKEVRDAAQSGR
jgi:hypothetical protein